MKARRKKYSRFPCYLKPGPANQKALIWLGKRLCGIRGRTHAKTVAAAAKVKEKQILAIERGVFRIGLGQLRQIVSEGYEFDFGDLLAECFSANEEDFNPQGERPFDRDWYYALTWIGEKPTALLIGGDPKSFLWAVPMRRLRGQAMVTEYLELAPKRKRLSAGVTPGNSHDGSEVVYVINGSVKANIQLRAGENEKSRPLRRGDAIHFLSIFPHNLVNDELNSN